MIGWQWCPGAYGYCAQCQTLRHGLWRYFASETTSTRCVCKPCADKL